MTTKHNRFFLSILLIAALVLSAIALCGCQNAEQPATTVPATTIDLSGTWYADIAVKDHGTVTVKLECSVAPITCANFIRLAQSGFYDGLTFHRIIEGFMAQGGDPEGTGTGGSDERIFGEFAANGYNNPLSHTRGAISMARGGYDYNSARSQFFIVHQDSIGLDGQYAVFGYVTQGMEHIDAICTAAQPVNGNGNIAPEDQPVIESITVRRETV
jgi:peptidyl-prolyl cis-trans isomerase B (cyclophilin B)